MTRYEATRNCALRGKTWFKGVGYTVTDAPKTEFEITPDAAGEALAAGILGKASDKTRDKPDNGAKKAKPDMAQHKAAPAADEPEPKPDGQGKT